MNAVELIRKQEREDHTIQGGSAGRWPAGFNKMQASGLRFHRLTPMNGLLTCLSHESGDASV